MSEPLHRIVPYERQFAQNLKSDILTDIFIENSKKKTW